MTLPKLCFFDIESSSLYADTGFIMGYGFLTEDEKLQTAFIKGNVEEGEKQLIQQCIKQLSKFQTVVTFYGEGYDFPMLVSRALKHGIDPSAILELNRIDLYQYVKEYMLLSKNSLDQVAKFFGIEKKTELTGRDVPQLCAKAIQGDKKALKQIKAHLKDDLNALAQLYGKLKPLVEGIGRETSS
mgnify:CR=1 FL=1